MKDRLILASILIPILLFIIWKGGMPFFLCMLLVNGIAQYEFYSLVKRQTKHSAYPFLGLVWGAVIITFVYWTGKLEMSWLGNAGLSFFSTLFLLIYLFLFLIAGDTRNFVASLGVNLAGVFYVSWLFSFAVRLRVLPPAGREIFLFLVAGIWIVDSAAYFGGTFFGRRLLMPMVSPKKTWEGFMAGLISGFLVSFLFLYIVKRSFDFFRLKDGIFFGLFIGFFGQAGDLIESLMKRNFGVKDSGSLFPEHGGMLDKLDSLLVAAPLFFWYLKIFVMN